MSTIPDVKIGQVWRDYDIRRRGAAGWRLILVVAVEMPFPKGAYAKVVSSYNDGHTWGTRRTKIRLDRFKPTSTGYYLLNRDLVDLLQHYSEAK